MNAKLEAVEARTEARFTTLDAKIDKIGSQIDLAVKSLQLDLKATKEAAEDSKTESQRHARPPSA